MTEITDDLRAAVSKDDGPWSVITADELTLMIEFIRAAIREHDKGQAPNTNLKTKEIKMSYCCGHWRQNKDYCCQETTNIS